jgi:WD40 repeat protein
MTFFRSPISISTPHTYISTGPFLPSESPLSMIFSRHFTEGIKVQDGRLLSWPAPPLEWIGHEGCVNCTGYSPNGCYIITGSDDKTIRIWDAETGSAVGKPLEGHTSGVLSVAYSPDGRHIISGSYDNTIRIWDAETGSTVGKPLVGHTSWVFSVAYSPDGRHITSGSYDNTIRIWDAEIGSAVGKPLEGHTSWVSSVAYSPDGRHIISGSYDNTTRIWDAETGSAVGKPLEGHTGAACCQLLTLPMGGTSSLDQMTTQFECGMPRLVLQSASL